MKVTILFDIISTIGFGVALYLAFRIKKNLIGHPSRIFLTLFLTIYFIVGVSNVLKHGGLANFLTRYDHYAELIFPPIFLFFIFPVFSLYIFSVYMKQDLERRMIAEESLRDSEARYRNLFEHSLVGIGISTGNSIVAANQALLDLFGYTNLEEFKKVEIWSRTTSAGKTLAKERKLLRSQGKSIPKRFEHEIIRKDGEVRKVEVAAGEITIENKKYIQSTFRDITEQKLAEEKLRQAKEEWERTFDTVPDHIAILDNQQKIMRVNKTMAKHLNVSPEKIIGLDFDRVVHGSLQPLKHKILPEKNKNGSLQSVQIYEETPGGHYLVSISALENSDGETLGAVRVGRDISDLKRIEHELEETRIFLQSVIDGVSDSILVIDKNYCVRMVNKTASDIHAIPLPLSKSVFCHKISHNSEVPCFGDQHPCPLNEVIATRNPVTMIHTHSKPDGSTYAVEIAASPLFDENDNISGIIEVGRDITEKLRLEEEQKNFEARLFQQQKDQSIVNLAKGVAHDFNNMLGTVLGNVELLQMGTVTKEEECGIVEAIGSAAQKMTDLTRQLLAYAKGGTYKLESLNINKIVAESLRITHHGEAKRIKVSFTPTKDLWEVFADPGQMTQMLVNVLTNGFEAMEVDGGQLIISTSNIMKQEQWECTNHNIHSAGDYILITISDTGPGIPKDIIDKIFEPFVSSKFLGRGLGLSAATGIVQNHGGCITFDNKPEEGATFHLLLPRANKTDNMNNRLELQKAIAE